MDDGDGDEDFDEAIVSVSSIASKNQLHDDQNIDEEPFKDGVSSMFDDDQS